MTKMTTDPPGKRDSDHDELDSTPVELCDNTSNGKIRGFKCTLPKGHAMGTVQIGIDKFTYMDHEFRDSLGERHHAWKDAHGVYKRPTRDDLIDAWNERDKKRSLLERNEPDAAYEFAGIGRSILIATILTQRAKIAELESKIKECGDPICDSTRE